MKRILLAVSLALATHLAHAADITVAAAASLSDAMTEAAKVFKADSGTTVHFSFAASSTLAKQIEAGAPVALFISADEDWMNYLDAKGLVAQGTRKDLLGNSLVLIESADKTDKVDIGPGFALAAMLGQGKLAMGEPSSVPAGKYGRDALISLGVWDAVAPKVVSADSVRSALAFVQTGEAPYGIVYATDAAIAKQVRVAGTFPAASHKPITYPVAVIRNGDNRDARAFLNFVEGPKCREIFSHFGFSEPTP
jgi:molybdate transport system substrate-binding protein